ncbi:MAG: hypothetical protein DMG13_20830 [Acidobacteria bacterium]|nr:MAG: hypothetical protein DMG13_20830 [Acidobacteriota bacterium]
MRRIAIPFSLGLLVSVLTGADAVAQATAQINGTVKSQAGAVLPGAVIKVTQTGTGIVRQSLTDETGYYTLSNLPIGPYRLEVGSPGFRNYVRTGIVLHVNSSPVINVELEVGQETNQVEVQTPVAMVETQNSSAGQVFENDWILGLPLSGRNVTQLSVLAGETVQMGTTAAGSPILNIASGLGFGTAYNLDGADHRDSYTNQGLPLPFPDAIQEFEVQTGGLSARHGEAASVGAVTKSGTNQFHGDVFEFLRNDWFNAKNYFDLRKRRLKRNQFGGTVGGPIKPSKLFFFGGYQGTTLRQDPGNFISFVPTAAMMSGDWTGFTSPACNAGGQISLRQPFVNNRIDPGLYSRAALIIASRLPKASDPCGQIVWGLRSTGKDGQVIANVDYQASDKHSLFGRYVGTYTNFSNPSTSDNLLSTTSGGFETFAQSYNWGDTYRIGANTVNAFRLTVNRETVTRTSAEFFSPSEVGIIAYSYVPRHMFLSVASGFTLGSSGPASFRTTSYHVGEDVSTVRGTHQMAFGANLTHARSNGNSNLGSSGSYLFSGQSTGLGMADFLTGQLTIFAQSTPNALYMKQSFVGLYGMDTWKMTQRLTINYGLRWEPFLPPVSTNGRVYNFDYDRFRQGIKSMVFRNAPAGLSYPGDPGFPGKSGINTHWLNFAPRLGFAWDVNGNGHTSVRASYGLAYDYLPLQWRINAGFVAPWNFQTTLFSPPGGLVNPWRDFPGGNPYPIRFDQDARFPPYGSYETTPYNIRTPYVSSWNFSIQRQVGTDWLVSTTYMGSHTVHMWVQKPLNSAVYIPGGPCTLNGLTYPICSTIPNTNQRRRLILERPQDGVYFGVLDAFESGGTQSYNGLLLSVQRRAGRGITVSGNYTWSHCISDYADTAGLGPSSGASYLDPNNRDYDRGNCDSDRRHILNLMAMGETPRFAGSALRAVAGGWRVSGIFRKSSGAFLTVTSGSDIALTGTGIFNQRVNQVLTDPYLDKSAAPLTTYLNRSAFQLPRFGTLGSKGRATIEGPGTWQLDAALSKTFPIGDRQKVEFRAEAYNVTNSFRPGNPDTALNSFIFGQIRTALDPRIMQFALKYSF